MSEPETPEDLSADLAAIAQIDVVPSLLELVLDSTGLGFGAVARVTDGRWVCCAVLDRIDFGLAVGGELEVSTTFCSEIRDSRAPIVIDQASTDPVYSQHRTPKLYGFESYIAVPIIRRSGEVFGTICALDPAPADLRGPTTLKSLQRYADLIATQLDLQDHLAAERVQIDEIRAQDARLEAVLEGVSDGFYALSPEWRYTIFNRAAEQYFGIDRADVIGRTFDEMFPQGRGTPFLKTLQQVMKARVTRTMEAPSALRPGRTVELRMTPMSDGGVGVSLTDITERRAAEDRQQLLINELNHRVKNTLATVQSIAAQTARRADSLPQFRDSFEGRLLALSRAHDVLTRHQWDSAGLHDILVEVMAPFHPGERLVAAGPAVRLSAGQALAFAMAFHELATNAVKYGAWKGPTGRVRIDWSLETAPAGVRLTWTEEGGPAVAAPSRKGFGSRLLEQGLARDLGGSVELRFVGSGLQCQVWAPLDA